MKHTEINRNLILTEPEKGVFYGTDALLLAHFMKNWKSGIGIEFGTGSGIIPLLILSGGAKVRITGIEIQKEYCDAANKNATINGFSDLFKTIHGDIKNIKSLFPSGLADAVFTNPPYLTTTCGKKNESKQKYIAFHEECCGINDICESASWCLKTGGKFYAVYRPERLAGLIFALRKNRIEPKKIRFVLPSTEKPPTLVLIEAKKDANEGLIIQPNLYIYSDNTHTKYSKQMRDVYKEFE